MEKVNLKKVIISTLLKILLMVTIFFTVNNWVHIKQSFGGGVPPLQVWLNHGFTLSNLILIILLSFIFYMNTLKKHKELVEKRSGNTEM